MSSSVRLSWRAPLSTPKTVPANIWAKIATVMIVETECHHPKWDRGSKQGPFRELDIADDQPRKWPPSNGFHPFQLYLIAYPGFYLRAQEYPA
jgi:hypothetical protein